MKRKVESIKMPISNSDGYSHRKTCLVDQSLDIERENTFEKSWCHRYHRLMVAYTYTKHVKSILAYPINYQDIIILFYECKHCHPTVIN